MILLKCNASPKVGFGHLSRCRSLAEELTRQGAECALYGPSRKYKNPNDEKIFSNWISECELRDGMGVRGFIRTAESFNAGSLVIDDYRVEGEEQYLLHSLGFKWLQFEVRGDVPVWSDFVVNANPAASESDYKNSLKRKSTKFLLGPKYAVIRGEFKSVTPVKTRSDVKNVLVSFGGGNDRGAIISVLSALCPVARETIVFHLMVSKNNPHLDYIKSWVGNWKAGNVRLHVQPAEVSALMRSCDLAITAGGTMTYELAACGVPMIIYAISEDQRRAVAWEEKGAAYYMGDIKDFNPEKLMMVYKMLEESSKRISELSSSSVKIVDGQGASRVSSVVVNELYGAM